MMMMAMAASRICCNRMRRSRLDEGRFFLDIEDTSAARITRILWGCPVPRAFERG
jgi:hypothetical protein